MNRDTKYYSTWQEAERRKTIKQRTYFKSGYGYYNEIPGKNNFYIPDVRKKSIWSWIW